MHKGDKMEIWTIAKLEKGRIFEFTGDMKTKMKVGDIVSLWNKSEAVDGEWKHIIYSVAKILKAETYDVYQAEVLE